MKKLVIDGRFLMQPVTGVQRVAVEFCRALDAMVAKGELPGVEAVLVLPRRGEVVSELGLRCIKTRRFGSLRGHLWEQLELPIAARGARLLSIGNTAPVASLVFRPTESYVMVHDLSFRYFPDAYTRSFRLLYRALVPMALKRAATIFTVSESERDAILRTYPRLPNPCRIVAVQNGTTASPNDPLPDRASRGRRCLYVGSLTKRKNAEGLIAAAIRLVRDHDATFTFIGATGPGFEGVRVDIPPTLSSRIRFLGQVNSSEALIHEYLSSAVLLFPSFYEASPLPPTEAMACGCPVVAAAIPSLIERCGPAAEYCDPNDTDSIVEAAVRVLDDEEVWRRLSSAGVRRKEEYSWLEQARRIADRVLEL